MMSRLSGVNQVSLADLKWTNLSQFYVFKALKLSSEKALKYLKVLELVPRAGLEPARPFNRIPGF